MGFLDKILGAGGNDESERDQLKSVQAEPFVKLVGARLLDACDSLPGASGRFGLDPENPIPVNGVLGEITYLNTLRGRGGKGVLYHRVGSQKISASPHPVDEYEVVTVDAGHWATLYFSMYHPRRSRLAPEGFTRMPWNDIPAEAKALIHLPAMGSHSPVRDFPMGLPQAVRDSPMLKAFSPGLGDSMARGVERILDASRGRWTSPRSTRERLSDDQRGASRSRPGGSDERARASSSVKGDGAGHTTLWLPVRPDHPVLAAAGISSVTHVPVFVDGDEYRQFKATRQVDVSPRALLFGAVLRAFEDPPGISVEGFRESLPHLLEVMAKGFGAPDLELMLINVAANLREEHGSALSKRALENIVRLRPEYHRARSDLIVELSNEAGEASDSAIQPVLLQLLRHFDALDRGKLFDGPRAVVCQSAVMATAILRGPEEARVLLRTVEPEIVKGDAGALLRRAKACIAESERRNTGHVD